MGHCASNQGENYANLSTENWSRKTCGGQHTSLKSGLNSCKWWLKPRIWHCGILGPLFKGAKSAFWTEKFNRKGIEIGWTGNEMSKKHQEIVRLEMSGGFFCNFWKFYWSIVDLQRCVNFCCPAKWFCYTHLYILFYLLRCQILQRGSEQEMYTQNSDFR